jgi:hypothetical protein
MFSFSAEKHLTVVEPSPTEALPYLGAEEVIDEVILLLAKMESGRKDNLDSLAKERQRSEMLKTKIDSRSHQRMVDLPIAVQRGWFFYQTKLYHNCSLPECFLPLYCKTF